MNTAPSSLPKFQLRASHASLILYVYLTDHVQLTAISQALKVNLKIAYLDGRNQDGHVEYVTFKYANDENETPLTLIYRCDESIILVLYLCEPR